MVLTILERLESRFRLLEETGPDLSWKSWEALRAEEKGKGEGPAYHALMATAGPATDNSTWTRDWTSPNGYTFKKGTPAPKWTTGEIHQAMAPQIRRWAYIEAKRSGSSAHNARNDPNHIEEIIGNMHANLQSILDREQDEGRILGGDRNNGFVSYVTPQIRLSGGKGIGGTNESRRALGRAAELRDTKNPAVARRIAAAVKPPFDTQVSNKKSPDNPYGRFSPEVVRVATKIADALESGNAEEIAASKKDAIELYNKAQDAEIYVQGTHSGKKAIHTPHFLKDRPPSGWDQSEATPEELEKYGAYLDREKLKKTQITSVSGGRKEDGGDIDIYDDTPSLKYGDEIDPDVVYTVLKDGRVTPEKYLQHPSMAHYNLQPLSDFDLRYLIRIMARWLPKGDYPGKGILGKDPELDPETGEPSPWVKEGQPQLWDEDEILKDIGRGKKQVEGASSHGLDHLVARVSEPQQRILKLLANGVSNQAEISRKIGISTVAVGKGLKRALETLGMTKDEFLKAAKSGGTSLQGNEATGRPRINPVAKFTAWMKYFNDQQAIDESVDPIDYGVVWRCHRAIMELYHKAILVPLLEGRRRCN